MEAHQNSWKKCSLHWHHWTLRGGMARILSPTPSWRGFYAAGRDWSFC